MEAVSADVGSKFKMASSSSWKLLTMLNEKAKISLFLFLLLLIAAALCSAEKGEHQVIISDDTELDDDTETGDNTVTLSVPEPESAVERIKDSRPTAAEFSTEISDETETEAEPEKPLEGQALPGSVAESDQPSEEVTKSQVQINQEQTVAHSAVISETAEVQNAEEPSPSAAGAQQQLSINKVVTDVDAGNSGKEAENAAQIQDSSEVEANVATEITVEPIEEVDETEVEERIEKYENQQKLDHEEEEIVTESTEDGRAPTQDTEEVFERQDEKMRVIQSTDESFGEEIKKQKPFGEIEPERAEKQETSAESQSVGKDIKEVVEERVGGEAVQEVSDKISKSEGTESVEMRASSDSEKTEEKEQEALVEEHMNVIGNEEEIYLEDDVNSKGRVSLFESETHSFKTLAKDDAEIAADRVKSDSKIPSGAEDDTVTDYESDVKRSNEDDAEIKPDTLQVEEEEPTQFDVDDVGLASGRTDLPNSKGSVEKEFYEKNDTPSDASVGKTYLESVDSVMEGNQEPSTSEDVEQQRNYALHNNSQGFGLRSDNQAKTDSNLDKIPVNENADDEVKYSSSDSDDESIKSEDEKNEHQDESPGLSVFTLKPWFVISETVLSSLDPYLEDIISAMPSNFQKLFLEAPFSFSPPRNLLLFAGSCLSLLIVLSCGCLGSSKQRSQKNEKKGLLQKLSAVQQELLISEQEKEVVANELESLKKKCQDFKNQSTTTSEQAGELSERNSELTKENETLQEKFSKQQSQKNDLSAKVSSQAESIKKLSEKHKALQKKLEDAAAHKNLLETQLYEMRTTLQKSESAALEMQSQLKSMEQEIAILQTSKDQLLLEAEGWDEKVHEQGDQILKLLEQEKTLLESNSLKEKELSVLQDCYQQLKLFESSLDYIDSANGEVDGEEDEDVRKKRMQDEVQLRIKSMIDVTQTNARLKVSEEEKSSLKNALKIEMESRMELEDQIKQMKTEKETLMESRHEAEQQASTTAIKMDVLVNYFKEKETDLTRKLGEQEARERANVDQLVSTDEKTKDFEKMVHLYKEQVEDLQKEIQNIEADYRKQIALQEKKAHENWLVARQSERDVKEYKSNAQILRLKISELQNRLDTVAAESKGTQESGQTNPRVANGAISMLTNEDRPTSRPLFQNPPFGLPPPFAPIPYLPADRPLPPPLFGHHPLPPPMMFDRRQPEMRSPPPFDMWPPPSHLHRPPAPPRDRSPPRGRSPSPLRRGISPESQRSRMSPSSVRAGRHSPTHSRNRSPPPVIGNRHSPYIHGPRIPPSGTARPVRPPYNRTGHDSRPGP